MSYHDITFVICSCDKYEDAWHPFFELLHIYGVDPTYPMVLNTETKQYTSPHFNIRVVNTTEKVTWSKRMRNVLEQIDTEFVFLLLEDYFLKAPFDNARFESVLDYMRTHPDVAFLDIAPWYSNSVEEVEAHQRNHVNTPDSFRERNNKNYNICVVPSIYRRDAFLDLLRDHEDVWQYERYVGIRAAKHGYKVVRYNTHTPTIYEYDFQQTGSGLGITRGQWLPGNAAFFAQHGIEANLDRLGVLDVATIEEIKNLRRSPKEFLRVTIRKLKTILNLPKSLR